MTSLRRSKKRENRDPLRANINKREDNDLSDRVPNDPIEFFIVLGLLVFVGSVALSLLHLAGKL